MERALDISAFVREYERVTNTQDPDRVAALIAEDATYWFTDGSYVGRNAIREALARTWRTIRDETYEIRDLEILDERPDLGVFRYRFHWSGVVDGESKSGEGRGSNIAVRRAGRWLMLHEHLST